MALVNRVEQKAYLNKDEIIKFQLITYCFFRSMALAEHELECLTLLAQNKEVDLGAFCRFIAQKEIYASAQSVRNVLNRLERKGLISKTGKKNKRIQLHPDILVQTEGNILLEFKLAHRL